MGVPILGEIDTFFQSRFFVGLGMAFDVDSGPNR